MENSETRNLVQDLTETREEKCASDSQISKEGNRLNWMYKEPSDLVDREEYLLGRVIDKTFEVLNGGNSDVYVGRAGETSNVPKRLLEKSESTEQVDIAKKILEDPLYAIKQKEMEARKKLLNNPVKLKQIQQMLLERNKNFKTHKKPKKKLKKKKKTYPNNLDFLILQALKKLNEKEKRKALKKVEQWDSDYSSNEINSFKKKNKRKKRSCSFSSSSSEISINSSCHGSISSNFEKYKSKKKKVHKSKKKKNFDRAKESDSLESSYSEEDRIIKSKEGKKEAHQKNSKKSLSSSYLESSSLPEEEEEERKKKQNSGKKLVYKTKNRHLEERKKIISERSQENILKRTFSNEERKLNANYGLMMPDGSRPETKSNLSHIKKYEKAVKTTTKCIPYTKAKPLSHEEASIKLKEMMEDAKKRKEEREKNLAEHRKRESKEEQDKSYDDDFVRRQMSQLTSRGSMADRIKSNVNYIQRSKNSMDSSFMKK